MLYFVGCLKSMSNLNLKITPLIAGLLKNNEMASNG